MLTASVWLALVVSIPVLGMHRPYVTAATAGAILIAGTIVAIFLHSRQPASASGPLDGVIGRLPARIQPRLHHVV